MNISFLYALFILLFHVLVTCVYVYVSFLSVFHALEEERRREKGVYGGAGISSVYVCISFLFFMCMSLCMPCLIMCGYHHLCVVTDMTVLEWHRWVCGGRALYNAMTGMPSSNGVLRWVAGVNRRENFLISSFFFSPSSFPSFSSLSL